MNMVLWIGICMLAAIGAVQVGGWIAYFIARPQKRGGDYRVVSLPRGPDSLEGRLRYALLCRRWSGRPQEALVLLLETEPDEESAKILEKALSQELGVYLCKPEELSATIRAFDNLQTEE